VGSGKDEVLTFKWLLWVEQKKRWIVKMN